jgi:PAS domain S-box-containing protein
VNIYLLAYGHNPDMMTALAVVALLGVVLGFILHRRVAGGQTAVVREWLRREAAQSRQYRELIESAGDSIFVYDFQGGTILDCNRKACEVYGWDRNALVGSSLKTIATDVNRYEGYFKRLQHGESCCEFTTVHSLRGGGSITMQVNLSKVEFAGKMAVLSFNRDITAQVEVAETLKRRGAILEAVSFAAEKLLSGGNWESDIQSVLERLGRSMAVSRAYLFENHPGPDGDPLTSQRCEWAAPGITPQIDNPELQDFSWTKNHLQESMEELRQGQIGQGIVADLPELARKHLEVQGIKSIISVPIFVGEKWWGFIGFDDCLTVRRWSTV